MASLRCSHPSQWWLRVALFGVLFYCVVGIQFDVHPGETRCIFDDYTKGQIVKGSYKIPQVSFMLMGIKIFAPETDQPTWTSADASEGTFGFTAEKDGIYEFCFSDKPRPGQEAGNPMTRRITFFAQPEWSQMEDKETVELDELRPVEYFLRSIEQKVEILQIEVRESRYREARHRETNENIAWRVPTFSTFTIVMLLIVGVCQMCYLKNYFKKKKLI
eukprot:TRINITY_DN2379_c0_g1_i1.p1 TRINITY_DN2379_c0_g1~~TRINITY_DN2379_c0_g1_i1.p1  ORF type:complete len:218 (+),score=28.26 TRINITY_DN2379_c0_g1_i1:75-728(+)